MAQKTATRVDPDISDLFFNYDLEDAKKYNDGKYEGFDDKALSDKAETFLSSIRGLTSDAPSVSDLLEDFHARL